MKKTTMLKFAKDTEGDWVPLPLSMLMQTIFFGGYKGSGKTTAMKKLFEAAHEAGAQCVSVAPLGKWYSLRVARNGKGKGLRRVVVFGGEFGDVPLAPGSGRIIARAVHTKKLHAVLDVELMRKDDRAVLLADFFEELMMLRRKGRHGAMVVFLDETQSVAPQMSTSKEVARLRALLGDFARECRNFGCGLVMSAQRSASVDKELIALCDMLIVMRTVHHLDRTVYKKWVDEKGSDDDEDHAWLRKLRRLSKGEAYLYAPEQNVFQRVNVEMIKTYDATATATIGARVARVGKLGKLDVKRLSAELSELVEKVAGEDPAALKAKIRELEAKLAAKPQGYVAKASIEFKQPKPQKVDKCALKKVIKTGKAAFETASSVARTAKQLGEIVQEFAKAAAQLAPLHAAPITHGLASWLPQQLPVVSPITNRTYKIQAPMHPDSKSASFPNGIPARAERVAESSKLRERLAQPGMKAAVDKARAKLDAADEPLIEKQIFMLRALLSGPLARQEMPAAVGMAPGGTFRRYVGNLKARGLVEEHGNMLSLVSGVGLDALGANSSLPLNYEAIVERNRPHLIEKQALMIEQVRQRVSVPRVDLPQFVGMEPGGTFRRYVGNLKSRGLLVESGSVLTLAPLLMRGLS